MIIRKISKTVLFPAVFSLSAFADPKSGCKVSVSQGTAPLVSEASREILKERGYGFVPNPKDADILIEIETVDNSVVSNHGGMNDFLIDDYLRVDHYGHARSIRDGFDKFLGPVRVYGGYVDPQKQQIIDAIKVAPNAAEYARLQALLTNGSFPPDVPARTLDDDAILRIPTCDAFYNDGR